MHYIVCKEKENFDMKIRKRMKDRMKYAPMYKSVENTSRTRLYFNNYCCRSCFFDWGIGITYLFEGRSRLCYKHEFTESNYKGLLKKHWKTSRIDRSNVEDDGSESF